MRRIFLPIFFPADLVSPSAAGALLLFAAGGATASADAPRVVPFEVRCIVTDTDNRPLEQIAVRLSLDSGPAVHDAGHGIAFQTDAQGKHVLQVPGTLTPNKVKRPTNWVDSLFSGKEATDDLQLNAQLDYLGMPMLYSIRIHRFRKEQSVLHYGFSIYTRDERGNFAQEVKRDQDGGWRFPGLGGLVASDPGWKLAGGLFYPDESDPNGRWIFECRLMHSPEPVRR